MVNQHLFNNPNVPNSFTHNKPPVTGMYLMYGYDQGLGKNIFLTIYYRTDTEMFYMDLTCMKENGLENYWKIHPDYWILLEELSIDSFKDR